MVNALSVVLSLGLGLAPAPQGDDAAPASPFVRTWIQKARDLLAEGDRQGAIQSVRRALERDDKNLGALSLLAEIAEQHSDPDTTVHTLHRWLEVWDHQERPPVPRKARDELEAHLLELDPDARAWDRLQKSYVRNLTTLGNEYKKRKDWLGALDAWHHLLEVEPGLQSAIAAIRELRRTGGQDVAIEDVYAGGDPTAGMSTEQIAAEDRKHSAWDQAYTKNTDNYRYRTDAGFLVLETSAIAMEQMNGFYRRFFHFKEDGGKTPKIEIRVFKSRDEYLELGQSPAQWSGGHFIGSAVETFVGGVTGKESIRDMYRTLFHEAAHQFVSLTGPLVPGWLNEAYASFFEGCVILSNGTVKWNQPPPGRLFPLANRLERGFMSRPDEASEDAGGEWVTPDTAPPFRMVVEGHYRWGPPWYAPTWGVVYFLYNYRSDDGRPVYRAALHEYYKSFRRGQPQDPIAHFEDTVLKTSPLSPVATVGALDPIWKEWILALRDRETGASDGRGERLLGFAAAALERGEKNVALEFLEEARDDLGDEPDLLWRMATLLEDMGQKPRAAALYRQFKRELELRGATDDERLVRAERKIFMLDPLAQRYKTIKRDLAEQGLALARSYEDRQLPTMALEIARRMSASFSIPEAMDYYVALAERTGLTLARWRVAYNEQNLDGWSGDSDVYQAYGSMIRAIVDGTADGGGLATSQLTCDVTFDADFSLEAQMRIEAAGADGAFKGRLMGLCFGRKGDQDFHAVLLHPKGFLDISSNRGGEWTVHDHRSVPVDAGAWHTMRIDVTGQTLDVYLDGLYVRSLEFHNPAAMRGGFGLITGAGEATYRNVRLLARDPHDPAARIERKLAMQKVMADGGLRQAGSFAGREPPELDVEWQQGEPTTLTELRGRPVLLGFWTPSQDKVIPCTAFLCHLIARGRDTGLETILVCDRGTTATELAAYLKEHPIPGAHIAIDAPRNPTYEAYWIKAGHFGIPRILLIDRAGKVMFEGDPGLHSGVGWQPDQGKTYVDDAFEKLLGS